MATIDVPSIHLQGSQPAPLWQFSSHTEDEVASHHQLQSVFDSQWLDTICSAKKEHNSVIQRP